MGPEAFQMGIFLVWNWWEENIDILLKSYLTDTNVRKNYITCSYFLFLYKVWFLTVIHQKQKLSSPSIKKRILCWEKGENITFFWVGKGAQYKASKWPRRTHELITSYNVLPFFVGAKTCPASFLNLYSLNIWAMILEPSHWPHTYLHHQTVLFLSIWGKITNINYLKLK